LPEASNNNLEHSQSGQLVFGSKTEYELHHDTEVQTIEPQYLPAISAWQLCDLYKHISGRLHTRMLQPGHKQQTHSDSVIYEQKHVGSELTCPVSKPQIVQVVSILDVPIRFGSTSFQSNDVSGAQKSEFLF
jgi:hypothetical protein